MEVYEVGYEKVERPMTPISTLKRIDERKEIYLGTSVDEVGIHNYIKVLHTS